MLDVVRTIQVGAGAFDVDLSPDGTRAYVTNMLAGSVSVIDTTTDTVTATIDTTSVGPYPVVAAVHPDGSRLYVTIYNDTGPLDRLAVIDTATHVVVASLPLGHVPYDAVISPAGDRLYVVALEDNVVHVIDTATNSMLATIPMPGQYSAALAITPDGGRLFVTNPDDHQVHVIDTGTATIVATIPIPHPGLGDVAVHPNGAHAYVVSNSGAVVIIDIATSTVLNTAQVDIWPTRMAFTPDGARCYVLGGVISAEGAGTLSEIDTPTTTVLDTIPVGDSPVALTLLGDHRRIYVVNYYSGTVSVVAPSLVWKGKVPELVGSVFGGAAAGGGGWIVIGGKFYRIPPRSPLLVRIAQIAGPHLERPIENQALAAKMRTLQ